MQTEVRCLRTLSNAGLQVIADPTVHDPRAHVGDLAVWIDGRSCTEFSVSRIGQLAAYGLGAARVERSLMSLPSTSESEIHELGGEPLIGSGFENERPSSAFEPIEQRVKEGSAE